MELPVCLHSRAAAASTSVAPSGSPAAPPLPSLHPLLTTLSLPSLPLAAFSFTCGSLQRCGSLLVRRTKMDGMEGAMDGGWRVGVGWGGVCVCVSMGGANKGFVSGACRRHTCCLKRADIRAQQDTAGWGGDGGVDVL